MTFDDGPYEYTDALIDLLISEKVVATFFVNGKNYW
jgi:peptidoglycan/xylan/chitin deacetylase (PgdA/CDA1 family)